MVALAIYIQTLIKSTVEKSIGHEFDIVEALISIVLAVVIVTGFIFAISMVGGKKSILQVSPTNTFSLEKKDLPPTSPQLEPGKVRSTPPYPISYTIGGLDPRFGLTRQKLLRLIGEAAEVWETPIHGKLFKYDSLAGFKINMRFDERQAAVLEAKRLRARIAMNGRTFDELKLKYDAEVDLKEKLEEQYKNDESELNRRLANYNSKVPMWNNRGGAPATEFTALERERSELDEMKRTIENEVATLNEVIATANNLAQSLNELATKHNLAVENYNDQFVTVHEFEKGIYNGWTINLFEFENDNDLRITLVHELGHVLGFVHVDDPNAVMYYKLERQDIKHIRLTNEDLKLLFAKFPRPS